MLSVIIIIKNEANHLKNCLESVRWADEIIVLDSGSTDNSIEIAKQYTPHVYSDADWQGYSVQKQRALDKATGDWVLNVDADEVVSEALKLKLQAIMQSSLQSGNIDGCRIPIQMVFYGKLMKYTASPRRHVRFYKRKNAMYCGSIVHENIVLPKTSRIIQLKEPLLHYSFQDLSHALYKMNRYTSYTARERLVKRKPVTLTQAILKSIWMFFKGYIIKGGFMDGKPGFVLAILNVEGAFYRSVKQIYRDKNLNDLPKV